ncbi:twin arginine-targeting protein translocase, TatA/E family [Rubidibacter lacunae KORDI 51-2]|uniref:Sec-independent protein translocase protein TatA n=1 Tax=Rubidibacter lacunae KORDI 51-2 TaxID=582515 RepID=U5D8N4_9CHRO|nr:TatA/E family twin arginine-targeting protein translocase [Rubidibacter lacunae]ERN40968.1 twin arginine-targeting protein translocase, TatA/E family [Rubidibacter lacunae KORDI 51-2]
MNVFGIGLPEMVLILAIALLVFGPKKLPEIGRSLGKAIRGFQDASKEFENEFKRESQELEEAVKMSARLEASEATSVSPEPNTPETSVERSGTENEVS